MSERRGGAKVSGDGGDVCQAGEDGEDVSCASSKWRYPSEIVVHELRHVNAERHSGERDGKREYRLAQPIDDLARTSPAISSEANRMGSTLCVVRIRTSLNQSL